MNIISSYILGLKNVFYVKKIVFTLYFLNVIFALAVAIPFASVLSTAIGYSDALKSLALSFDYTAYSHFMRENGEGLSAIFSVARWLIPIYLILQIFLNGGIINAFRKDSKSYTLRDFYKNSTTYFWKYFKVFLIFLVFHIIAIIIVIVPIAIIFSGGIDKVESEIVYWTVGYWGIGIYFILFTLIMIVSDYCKILLTKKNAKGIFRTVFKAWKLVFQHFARMYTLFLINFLVMVVVYWLYWQLRDVINPSSAGIAFLFILIQQTFNILRIYAKLTYYSSLTILTKDYLKA
jgi:hypothetical protein